MYLFISKNIRITDDRAPDTVLYRTDREYPEVNAEGVDEIRFEWLGAELTEVIDTAITNKKIIQDILNSLGDDEKYMEEDYDILDRRSEPPYYVFGWLTLFSKKLPGLGISISILKSHDEYFYHYSLYDEMNDGDGFFVKAGETIENLLKEYGV